jgi:hypothetical protein
MREARGTYGGVGECTHGFGVAIRSKYTVWKN